MSQYLDQELEFLQLFQEYFRGQQTITSYSAQGDKIETPYIDDQIQGIQTVYRPNGTLFKTYHYVDDKRHGSYIKYYETGQISKICYFSNNQLHGILRKYSQEGKIQRQKVFLNDQLTWFPKIKKQDPNFINFDCCSICFEPKDKLIEPIALLCDSRHIFCLFCIVQLKVLERQNTKCPLCRKTIE